MSGLVLHLTAAVVHKFYNLLVSFKAQKYITIILSIVLCRGDPHTSNIRDKCVLPLSDEEMFRMMSLDKDKISDDTGITFLTKGLRRSSGRQLAWIAGSIPVGDIEVYFFWVLCFVR